MPLYAGRHVARVSLDMVEYTAAESNLISHLLTKQQGSLNISDSNHYAEVAAVVRALSMNRRRLIDHNDITLETNMVQYNTSGNQLCGTPDGALINSETGMIDAVQVSRCGACKGRQGVIQTARMFIDKLRKSCSWVVGTGNFTKVLSFTIALWIPRKMSRKSVSALSYFLASKVTPALIAGEVFRCVLLVPPKCTIPLVFPPRFGEVRHRVTSASGASNASVDDEANVLCNLYNEYTNLRNIH